jgi:hypothetical protein
MLIQAYQFIVFSKLMRYTPILTSASSKVASCLKALNFVPSVIRKLLYFVSLVKNFSIFHLKTQGVK